MAARRGSAERGAPTAWRIHASGVIDPSWQIRSNSGPDGTCLFAEVVFHLEGDQVAERVVGEIEAAAHQV